MLNTEDVRKLLIDEVVAGNIHDTGYDCPSGNQFYEIKNATFYCDKDYICKGMHRYDRVDPQWYVDNYETVIRRTEQLTQCVSKLSENPSTRQAVIMITGPDIFYKDPVCTLFSHVTLDKNGDNDFATYNMTYTVHMRSSDAIEFGNDYQWHVKMIKEIISMLSDNSIWVSDVKVVWVADSFHIYKDFVKFL